MADPDTTRAALRALMSPEAVRARCTELLDIAFTDGLPHFEIDPSRLGACAETVAQEIRTNYPALDVPFHSRWRHFEFGGRDLWAETAAARGLNGDARTAAEGDLAVVSVLLDAGAGPGWSYTDAATGLRAARSEGLALASLRLFERGLFSADPEDPLRADASALQALTADALAAGMQAGPSNPLVGVEGRAALLRRLGAELARHRDAFARGDDLRPGNLLLGLRDRAAGASLPAREILVALLDTLTGIWPSGFVTDGIALGDVGRHPSLRRADATDGLVPFHKLSQWLSYSLIEPLQRAGAKVAALDGLTGLAEYRNGGLFVDTGVLRLRDPSLAAGSHPPQDALVVEWRALTVALLDRMAVDVRRLLGRSADELPLASVLQGGTWSAGRRVAAAARPGGPPPISVASDGTLF
jgi:hypothetical protein